MATYYYEAWEVDDATYTRLGLGDQHEGGTVVDGLCDGTRDVLLIVTRHGDEEED